MNEPSGRLARGRFMGLVLAEARTAEKPSRPFQAIAPETAEAGAPEGVGIHPPQERPEHQS